ncbi:SDR family NAD(P)-dependent oxidoreductase [Herminiimonas arsenitoxidans]|uniref:SDR family NAD(P)-dependent oxidoreductase n=1 Tax=Herminiimonas arsenitoxidans TaxID=1809410 RepID=UPI0009703774|nr:glucose 1-dehydrogenase [Herminiimonas arsenitoxidans]
MNAIRLDGKVAFITGGANGIGEGAAMNIARYGGDIAIADNDAKNGERVAAAVRALGRKAIYIPTDVMHTEQIDSAVKQTATHFGRLDILVNNAGGSRRVSFLEQSERSWRKHIDLNFISMLTATQAAAGAMISAGNGGTIINIASSEALRAAPGYAVYAACKAGMVSFTKSMSLELANHDIHVHALAPDMIKTPGLSPYFDLASAEMNAARDRYIPLARLGSTDEIGNVIVFLASGMASYLNGLTIPVDGGALASSGWTRSPTTGEWNLYHG